MTIFYLDLETSNLQGNTLIQIGCIKDKLVDSGMAHAAESGRPKK